MTNGIVMPDLIRHPWIPGQARDDDFCARDTPVGAQPILQPAPESASALAATPITLFSLFSTTRRYMSWIGLCDLLIVHLPRGLSMVADSMAAYRAFLLFRSPLTAA